MPQAEGSRAFSPQGLLRTGLLVGREGGFGREPRLPPRKPAAEPPKHTVWWQPRPGFLNCEPRHYQGKCF